jgi:hypothetical protein
VIIWEVRYGDGLTVMLRDPYFAGGYLRGVECNEFGVADRSGCRDAEFMVRDDRIESTREVSAWQRQRRGSSR